MPQENRQLHSVEDSPVHRARERLSLAMERVQQAVQQRLTDAENAVPQPSEDNAAAFTELQQNCAVLEKQNAKLSSDNNKLEQALGDSEKLVKEVRAVTRKAEEKLARVMSTIEKILES